MRLGIKQAYITPIALAALGLATRLAFITRPNEVVFDEVHFGKFVSNYFTGSYFFDIHPPLGKLLIALTAFALGVEPHSTFESIGQAYQGHAYVAFRLLPNLVGGLIPVCIYLFVRSLRGSVTAGLIAGLALVFDNGLLVQSHFIFVDPMLIFFGFGGLTLFFWYRNRSGNIAHLLLGGFLLALSVSVKWTGLAFIGLAGIVTLWDSYKRFIGGEYPVREAALHAVVLLLIPFMVYFAVFAIHFSLLPKSGPGDAFMSEGFKKTLEGADVRSDVKPHNLFEKFGELNAAMYLKNSHLSATHSYSSRPETWPVMVRPVYYWVKKNSRGEYARIYMLGNPMVWWTALAGMAGALFLWRPRLRETKWLLFAGWFSSFLPFFAIKRVLFLYHYLIPLIFSVVIMSMFLTEFLEKRKRARNVVLAALVVLFIAGFIFFSPLSYGFTLSEHGYMVRTWIKKWI